MRYVPHGLGMSYYVNFLEGLGGNEFHIKLRFGFGATSYLNSTANLAHLPRNLAEWAELAVLFS